jgi:hypothetical protein
MNNRSPRIYLHNGTATIELLEDTRKKLLDHLLDLLVLIVALLLVAILLLAALLLLSRIALLATILLLTALLATILLLAALLLLGRITLLATILLRLLRLLVLALALVLILASIVLAMILMVLPALLMGRLWIIRHHSLSTLQVDVHPPGIFFSGILQAELLAYLLDPRLDLLNMVDGMVALANDDMKMALALCLRGANTFLQDILCFFDKLAMKVDCVIGNLSVCVVLTEYVLRGLLVVLLHLCGVLFAFFGQLVSRCAITALVCLVSLKRYG